VLIDSNPGLALQYLSGGGEMGARMRALDWSCTHVGPMKDWPQSLRSAVSMLLPSKAQIILFWGPEFAVFYNDPYRPVFGAKHPVALGQPGREAWSEIWDGMLHELLAGVVRTGEAFSAQDLLFTIERHGLRQDTYFDVSYDPTPTVNCCMFCALASVSMFIVSPSALVAVHTLAYCLSKIVSADV